MSTPYILLGNHNVARVAERTGRSVEALEQLLSEYKTLGVYPVRVPLTTALTLAHEVLHDDPEYCPRCDNIYIPGPGLAEVHTQLLDHLKLAHPDYFKEMLGGEDFEPEST